MQRITSPGLFRRIFNWLRASGTRAEFSRPENIAIQNMNITLVGAMFTVTTYVVIDLYAQDYKMLLLNGMTIVGYVTAFTMIRFGIIQWGKVLGFFSAGVSIYLCVDALGRAAEAQLFYLIAMAVAFYVFAQTEVKYLFISLGINLMGWIASYAAPPHFFMPPALHPEYYTSWAPILITPVFVIAITYQTYHLFHKLVELAERQKNELIHASRMAAVGEMAGGMAHEINTPLGIIVGAASNLRSDLSEVPDEKQRIAKNLDAIENTAFRISKIIAGLLAFSRGDRSKAQQASPMSVKEVIDLVVSFCSEKYKNNGIALKVKVAHDSTVLSHGTQMSQVILNLVNNAFDAVRELGVDRWVEIHGELIDGTYRMTVIDSGRGIPDDVVSRMMEPFFTTKPIGHGTGLGLSISKGLVENLGGSLVYQPQDGHTGFIVEVPVRPT